MKTNFKLFALVLCIAFGTTAFVNPEIKQQDIPVEEDFSFAEFLSYFQKVELGLEIGLKDFQEVEDQLKNLRGKKKIKRKSNSSQLIKHLRQVEHGLYSRMGPPEILPVARFYPDEQTVAVVYIPYRPFSHAGNFSYKLALFDLQGNSLPRLTEERSWKEAFVLGHSRLIDAITFRIDQSGNIWQNHYEKIWRHDVHKKGPVGNEVIDYAVKDTKVFRMDTGGEIVALDVYPTDTKAKL